MANDLMNRRNDLFGGFNDWINDDHFFNNLGRMYYGFNGQQNELKTDIKETAKDYQVAVDLPGMEKKDITVNYDQDVLTIMGKKDSFADEADKTGNALMTERSYGSFTRQYRLPQVKGEQIVAKYDKGVLSVTLPKANREVESDHQIKIQ